MLSAFVVARDAEGIIRPALLSLRRLAGELLLIVDRATTDGTAAAAADLVDGLYVWPVDGTYEHVLNEAAALCHGEWILHAHDDELFPPAFRAALPALLEAGDNWAFPRRHVVGDGRCYIADAPLWPDYQLRLRSRGAWQAAPWPRQVHASPVPGGIAQAAIWHLKFLVKRPELRQQRLARWGQLWPPALGEHYRRFSIVEDYAYRVQAIPEEPPEELAAMLAATSEERQDADPVER